MRNEMTTLIDRLTSANIPFVVEEDFFGATHVMYPGNWADGCECSVVCNDMSYGHENELLEIMGLLDEEESEYDDVIGWLTAENVFARIYTHFMNR